jgi:hypothetical protein
MTTLIIQTSFVASIAAHIQARDEAERRACADTEAAVAAILEAPLRRDELMQFQVQLSLRSPALYPEPLSHAATANHVDDAEVRVIEYPLFPSPSLPTVLSPLHLQRAVSDIRAAALDTRNGHLVSACESAALQLRDACAVLSALSHGSPLIVSESALRHHILQVRLC